MRFDLETEIRFPNGERAGILRRVVLGEENNVESVVMATDDLISRDIIVPVSAFSEAPGNVLQLNLHKHDLARLPEYVEELVPAVPEGWEFTPPSGNSVPGADVFPSTVYDPLIPVFEVTNLPEGQISLSQGTVIYCLDERWGIVDEVLTGEDGHATAFVGRPDTIEEHDRLIPMDLISEYGSDAVILNCAIDDLPAYTQELENEAEEPEVE